MRIRTPPQRPQAPSGGSPLHPLDVPPFHPPSAASTAAFVAIVLAVLLAVVAGLGRPAPGEAAETTRRWGLGALVGGLVWLGLTAIPAGAGLLLARSTIPMAVPYVGLSLLMAVGLGLSPAGARLAALPPVAVVGFQVFRLPLEVVLHLWGEQGSLPVQMTWSGQNLDVLTGLAALAIVGLSAVTSVPRGVLWAFELLGSALLINVMRVALTSAPTPLRTFWNEPAVLLPFHLPYTWIVPVCVAGALLGHVVLARALWRGVPGG